MRSFVAFFIVHIEPGEVYGTISRPVVVVASTKIIFCIWVYLPKHKI